MTGTTFGLPITCHRCGCELNLVQSIARAGTEAVAIARCSDPACDRTWAISMQMRGVPNP